jgi:hypothetical protein
MGRRYANEGDLVIISPGITSAAAAAVRVLGSGSINFSIRKDSPLLVIERRRKLREALYPDLVLLEPGGRLLVIDEGSVRKVKDGI